MYCAYIFCKYTIYNAKKVRPAKKRTFIPLFFSLLVFEPSEFALDDQLRLVGLLHEAYDLRVDAE